MRDFILYGKDVGEFAVIALRPEMASILAVDKLPGRHEREHRPSNTALQQKGDAELLGHLLYSLRVYPCK